MRPRERFLKALRGEKPDRAPLACVTAFTSLELQRRSGCSMPEAHLDARQLFRLCAAVHEELAFDAVTFIINAFSEPAALGCRLAWGGPGELPVYLSHPWGSPADAVVPPDLLERPPIRVYRDALRLARRELGERVGVLGKVLGPLTLTQVMHGVEPTMIGLIDRPDDIRRFLERAVDIAAACANAQFDEGIDALTIGEGGAGANMLSPAMYEQLLLEFHQALVARIRGPTVMHICGDITPRIGALARVGFTCFNFDWAIPPARMKELAGGRFRIMGNVNTTDLRFGAPPAIEAQVAAALAAGVDIVSPGCAISPCCPMENLQALAGGIRRRQGAAS